MGIPTCVYVAANSKRRLTLGITRNLVEAVKPMVASDPDTKIVFAEWVDGALAAADLYDELSGVRRRRLLSLISSRNPGWWDLLEIGHLVVAGAPVEHADAIPIWPDDGDDSGGVRARLPIEPDDPVRRIRGSKAQIWPVDADVSRP